jgi:hypothetical protein
MFNPKNKRIFAGIIAVIVALAMIVPMALSYLI